MHRKGCLKYYINLHNLKNYIQYLYLIDHLRYDIISHGVSRLDSRESLEVCTITVVDVRNIFSQKNVELLETSDDFLYYVEEKAELGQNNLFIIEYSRKKKCERIIANYALNDPTFVQHIYVFDKYIIMLFENSGPQVWSIKLDKQTGEEICVTKLETYGPLLSCYALDERYVLIYTKLAKDSKNFYAHDKIYNFPKIVHLYDTEEGNSYRVLDQRLCSIESKNILSYIDTDGSKQALILSPSGDEYSKEQTYKNSRWLNTQVYDSIFVYPFDDLIKDIKSGVNYIKLKNLVSAGNEGLVRFTGMDEFNIYFKAKYFPTAKEKIYSISKKDFKISKCLDLIYDSPKTYYEIDKDGPKIYKISEVNGDFLVKGLLASNINTSYDKFLGEFKGCVEDRFVITRKIITNSDGEYNFEYCYIIDAKNKIHKGYEGHSSLKNNTLVLY